MVKKYYEADEIVNSVEKNNVLNDKDIEYEKIMCEIPNHNKKENNSIVIYRKKEYIIIKTSKAFIIHNRKKEFKNGHTHSNNYNYSKSLIDLSLRNKLPNRPNKRIISSLIRISNNKKYIEKLENIREELRNGKLKK